MNNNDNEFEDLELETLFITLEDNTEQECAIMDEFEMDGNDYLVLTTLDENGNPDIDELFFAKRTIDDTCAEDECIIDFLEDDEYETVVKYYDLLLDALEAEENGTDAKED